MRSFYGIYLTQLLGYDRIYVLVCRQHPGLRLRGGGSIERSDDFATSARGLQDLLQAVRDPRSRLPAYNVVETDVPAGQRDGRAASRRCRRQGNQRAAGNGRRLDHPSRPRLWRSRDGQTYAAGGRRRHRQAIHQAARPQLRLCEYGVDGAGHAARRRERGGEVARRHAGRTALLAQGPPRSGVHPEGGAGDWPRAHSDRGPHLFARPVGQPAGEAAGREREGRLARGTHRFPDAAAKPRRPA